jgi:antitoxin component YwqK of YwqJK toxin-antitoxin module
MNFVMTAGGKWLIAIAMLIGGAGPVMAAEWVQESQGQKAYYDAQGRLERVEIDADRDGRFEIEEQYADGKRLKRREDLDEDGFWERQFTWDRDGSAALREGGRKGEVQMTYYEPGGAVRRIEKDTDRNGTPEDVWEYRGGILYRVSKPGGTWYYQEGRLSRAELDENRNGSIDRIEYYDQGGRIEKAEELAAGGKVKTRWFYDRQGRPLRAEDNLDGQGRPQSRREFGKDGTVERVVDADRNGVVEIRERFAADGSLISREEDLDGDGHFDLRLGKTKED